MAWPKKPKSSMTGAPKLKPPMKMRSSTMQMPSMQKMGLRQPTMKGRVSLPSADSLMPQLPPMPSVTPPGVGGELNTKARNKLPASKFALPGKGEGKQGKGAGSYPIPDASHARNALSRVAQHGSSSEKATVRAKVHAKFPNIGKGAGDHGKGCSCPKCKGK